MDRQKCQAILLISAKGGTEAPGVEADSLFVSMCLQKIRVNERRGAVSEDVQMIERSRDKLGMQSTSGLSIGM